MIGEGMIRYDCTPSFSIKYPQFFFATMAPKKQKAKLPPILDANLRAAHPCGKGRQVSLFMKGEKAAGYQKATGVV